MDNPRLIGSIKGVRENADESRMNSYFLRNENETRFEGYSYCAYYFIRKILLKK